MNSESVNKPWNKNSSHSSYESADSARKKLLATWSTDLEKYAGMQVKVKRMSGDVFLVKTRLHPDFEPKKEKKRGKNKRRDKKASSKGKLDTSSVV